MNQRDLVDINWNALDRYFSGEASAEEIAILTQPGNARMLGSLREIWDVAGMIAPASAPPPPDVDRAWRALAERARWIAEDGYRRTNDERVRGSRRNWWVASVAAGLVLLAGGVAVWPKLTPPPAPAANVAMSEVVTRHGERASVRLADGTRITLAPGTTLRYPETFGVRRRQVFLDGQALFAVVHDTTRPFEVRTAHGVATDLGTRFVVRAYQDERRVDVAVTEGSVSLKSFDTTVPADSTSSRTAVDSLLLTAGHVGRLTANQITPTRRDADLDRYVAWTEGRLVFHDTPLPEALAEIGRWYDANIAITSSALAGRHVTASYRDESLTGVLQSIAIATGAHYERAGRTIRFSFRR